MKIKKVEHGFSLIELVVVMAIVAIVGTILVMIFSSTLRGSNKSQMLSAIKQGGQAVLENMDKTFRSSEDVVCPFITPPLTTANSTQIVIANEGVYTRYRFIAPTAIANGYIQRDTPTKQIVNNIEETDTEFINRICDVADTITSQLTVLTDTSSETGISVTSGSFTRSIKSGSNDSIRVQFTLNPAVGLPSTIVGQIDPVVFRTTIELRR